MNLLSSWPRFRLGAAGPLGVVIVIVYIESMRWVGVSPPTPFLLLFIAFVLAAIFGGVGSALVSAGLVALFTVYSAITSFGPSTLTGGPFQVSLGIAMTFALALVLGRMRTRSEAVRELEERIRMRMDDLAAMTELSRRALEYADLDTLFGEAVALLAGALRVKYCTVLELLPDGDALLLRAGVGWRDGLVGHATIPAGSESQGGYTLLRSEPVVIENLGTETRFRAPSLLTDHGVVSGMSVVIEGKDTPFGVLGLHTSVQRTFTEDDVRLLSLTANLLSTAIRHFADQRALRDERERLTTAQRIGHLGSWDNNYITNTLEWSDEVYRIFGAAPQEFGATEDAFIAAVHPDDRPRVIDAISASVTERRPYDIQHRIVRRDGSVRTVHGQGEVTFESDGTPSHIWGTVLDITDRAEAERTVAESEERLRAIVDTVRSGIVITDEQGAIRFTNRA